MQRADVNLVRACCVLAVLTAGLVPSEGFGIRGTTCPYDMKHSIVLDVRTANEWNQGHVACATRIDYRDSALITKVLALVHGVKSTPVVVYCHSGGRAGAAQRRLIAAGFSATTNAGGFSSWPQGCSACPGPGATKAPAASNKVAINWVAGFRNAAKRTEAVKAGDVLTFTWPGGHNVWKFPNKAAFDKCDFSSASQISGGGRSPASFTVQSTTYFACQVGSHCKYGQKLAAIVAAGVPKPHVPSPVMAPAACADAFDIKYGHGYCRTRKAACVHPAFKTNCLKTCGCPGSSS